MRNNRSYFLFFGLLLLLATEPLLADLPRRPALMMVAFTVVVAVGVFSFDRGSRVFRVGVGLAVVAVVSVAGYYATGHGTLRVIDLIATCCFCLLAIPVKLKRVMFDSGPVTQERIVGALSIYLLIGVLWTTLYALAQLTWPDSIHYGVGRVGEPMEQLLYFSFVTLTTLGYGDMSPVHPVVKTLAYVQAIVGQLYIAVMIADLVGRRIAALRIEVEFD